MLNRELPEAKSMVKLGAEQCGQVQVSLVRAAVESALAGKSGEFLLTAVKL